MGPPAGPGPWQGTPASGRAPARGVEVGLLVGRVRLGFSGRVLKWVLLVWMEMSFSSYWAGAGWTFTRCGLGVGDSRVESSRFAASQEAPPPTPRPPPFRRPPPIALVAGYPPRRPCKAARRRPPSSPAILARPQGAGRPPCWPSNCHPAPGRRPPSLPVVRTIRPTRRLVPPLRAR